MPVDFLTAKHYWSNRMNAQTKQNKKNNSTRFNFFLRKYETAIQNNLNLSIGGNRWINPEFYTFEQFLNLLNTRGPLRPQAGNGNPAADGIRAAIRNAE